MTILIYFLTIVFGIVCFVIMKKKRYKVMPLICLIMFICFIGCGIISILSLTLPYGELLFYPFGATIFGLIFILVGVNDLYSLGQFTRNYTQTTKRGLLTTNKG